MKWFVLMLSLLLLWLLISTRFGVFLVFDVVGDIRGSDNLIADPRQGPLLLNHYLEPVARIPLPDAIAQPSGLSCSAEKIWISTDQAELFALQWDGTVAIDRFQLIGGPLLLRQGSIEGVVEIDDNLVFAGELGALIQVAVSPQPQLSGQISLNSAQVVDTEFTGIEYVGNSFVLTADEAPSLIILSSQGELEKQNPLAFEALDIKQGRNPGEYLLSGLSHADALFVVTENYSTLLRIDNIDSAQVTAAYGLLGAGEISDVCIAGDRILVISDHNLFDAKPPITEYRLPL